MEILRFRLYYSQLKTGTHFFEKGFIVFLKNCLKFFKNPEHRFLEEHKIFVLAVKYNLNKEAFSFVRTKTNSNFAVNFLKEDVVHLAVYLMNLIVSKSALLIESNYLNIIINYKTL